MVMLRGFGEYALAPSVDALRTIETCAVELPPAGEVTLLGAAAVLLEVEFVCCASAFFAPKLKATDAQRSIAAEAITT